MTSMFPPGSVVGRVRSGLKKNSSIIFFIIVISLLLSKLGLISKVNENEQERSSILVSEVESWMVFGIVVMFSPLCWKTLVFFQKNMMGRRHNGKFRPSVPTPTDDQIISQYRIFLNRLGKQAG